MVFMGNVQGSFMRRAGGAVGSTTGVSSDMSIKAGLLNPVPNVPGLP